MNLGKQLSTFCLVTCLAALLAASESGGVLARLYAQRERRDISPRFLRAPSIAPNPNPRAPLAALVEFVTDRPVWAKLKVSDGAKSRLISFDGYWNRKQTLPILGLSPGKRYSILLAVTDTKGNCFTWQEKLEIATAPLPGDFPPLRVNTSIPDKMEPGITLFNVARYGSPSYGLLAAVDERGEVVWYFQADYGISNVIQLRNGNLLYLHLAGATEIDWLGNIIQQWSPTARGGSGRGDSTLVNADTFHHDLCELPNGNFLALSTELRRLTDYPSSESDPLAPAQSANVVGDVVIEFTRDGRIANQWSLFDLLDPYRIGYGSLDGFWSSLYGAPADGTRDWTHGNAVFQDSSEDSILLSLRHQDALVMFSRQTRALQWILGTPGGWNPPWSQYLLEPAGDLQWPYHQHASVVTPEGTILLFDNGNFRARPFEAPLSTVQSYSRVVEYRVDAARRTVSQLWSYGGPGEDSFYTPFGGSVYRLPHTGNVLVTDGARITDDAGKPTENSPGSRRWARIIELTHTMPAEKVFELIVGDDSQASRLGWSVYRSRRLPSLYPAAQP
ncbi:MAG TPA: aryl-sulfate sulfotransferase [Acidobacteriota bacterium]